MPGLSVVWRMALGTGGKPLPSCQLAGLPVLPLRVVLTPRPWKLSLHASGIVGAPPVALGGDLQALHMVTTSTCSLSLSFQGPPSGEHPRPSVILDPHPPTHFPSRCTHSPPEDDRHAATPSVIRI